MKVRVLPQIISAIKTPFSDAQLARFVSDYLSIVVETVEDLPQQYHRTQHQIDAAKDQNMILE